MTEDVIEVASIDSRMKRTAHRSREVWDHLNSTEMIGVPGTDALRAMQQRHDLERLREFLGDEAFNMQNRLASAVGLHKKRLSNADRRVLVKKLHMLTFDETYRDYAPSTKYQRTRERIEALLQLCHGDEALLLREYTRALGRVLPVHSWSNHFEWSPRLIERELKSGKIRRTIKFHMRRHSH